MRFLIISIWVMKPSGETLQNSRNKIDFIEEINVVYFFT